MVVADDVPLDSVLFVLEVPVNALRPQLIAGALFKIPIVLIAGDVSVAGPVLLLSPQRRFAPGSVRIIMRRLAGAAAPVEQGSHQARLPV